MNSHWIPRDFWAVLQRALLIALLAALIGLAVNGPLLWRVFSGRTVRSVPAIVAESDDLPLPLPVGLEEVRELQGSATLIIDARNAVAFAEGHLPGALSVPWEGDRTRLEPLLAEVSRTTPLIVYCSGYDCPDSFFLAEQLIAAGFRQVRVFEGGLPEWQDAGLPIEKEEP